MQSMLQWIIVCLSTVYSGLCLFLIIAALILLFKAKNLKNQKYLPTDSSIPQKLPSVSVIVPLRNEETCAEQIINALRVQDYAGTWEVIFINDRSTDRTAEILKAGIKTSPQLKTLDIPMDSAPIGSPKKRALSTGFKAARGEILMTTDADCIPDKGWIQSMASHFVGMVGIVQGPKHIEAEKGFIELYQAIETFAFVSIEAAGFAVGKPFLASAPSLAYRKSLFEAVGGFSGLEELSSGDDDMLVHRMCKQKGVTVAYNLEPEACVKTVPVHSFKELLRQRARWASNGTHYESKGYIALLFAIFSFYIILFFSPFLAVIGLISWTFCLSLVLLKVGMVYAFLGLSAQALSRNRLLKHVWWADLFHIPIVLLSVLLGQLGWYRWK